MGRRGKASAAPQAASEAPPPPPPEQAEPTVAALACFASQEQSEPFHGPVPSHPERPDRTAACVTRLRDSGLWRRFRRLGRRAASDAELCLIHSRQHLDALNELAQSGSMEAPRYLPAHGPLCLGGPCNQVNETSGGAASTDTYLMPKSLTAAKTATGGLLQLVDQAFSEAGERRGLALCRPPGHHASAAKSSGFCLVNNVAVAAAYARKKHGVQRVLIFDWDVHHCNGTQAIFEDSPDVLVVSAHRHDGKNFYPATGAAREVGIGKGKGYTVNVALAGSFGDAALWAACAEVLAPAARAFQPELILVSAGFDAAEGDPLGGCSVTPQLFGKLTTELCSLAEELCDGRIIFGLEGGYNLEALANCVEEVAKALVEPPRPADEKAFAQLPAWLENIGAAAYQRTAIRKTCEAHKGLALKLPMPVSKSEARKAAMEARGETVPKKNIGHSKGKLGCPGGHELSVFTTDDEFECSVCGGDVAEGERMRGCRECDYDICSSCLPFQVEKAPAAESSDPAANASCSIAVRPECIIVRMSPLEERPCSVAATSTELRLLFSEERSVSWRFDGVQAECREGVALCTAEWRPRIKELRLYLGLAALKGGPVQLTRLPS